jgi:hypothetical protein
MTDAPGRAAPDLPVSWHLAVIRAIVHTASYESQAAAHRNVVKISSISDYMPNWVGARGIL